MEGFARNSNTASTCAWATLLLAISPIAADAKAPHAVYLTWQGDTSTTITVNFHTAYPTTESEVRFDVEPRGNNPASYTGRANGSSHRIQRLKSGPVVHWVELTGLEPGRTYYFIAGDPYTGFSEERKFRTIPNDGSALRFVAGGDMGTGEDMRRLNRLAALLDPHFALIGGDIAYANGRLHNAEKWEDWIAFWCEDMVTPSGYTVPVTLAIGNHEVRSKYGGTREEAPFYFGLFAQDQTRSYFRRKFGAHLEIYVLDSGHIATHQEQAVWLGEELGNSREIGFRGAIYHVPLYPSHRDYAGEFSEKGRIHWAPLFDRYNFTFAFENHDHTFKRSRKIRRDVVAEDGNGVLYLGDGAWGQKPRKVDLKPRWYLEKAGSIQHFWQVDVFEHGAEYRAINLQGRVFDSYPPKVPGSAAANDYFEGINQDYQFREGAVSTGAALVESSKFKKTAIEVLVENNEPYPLVAEMNFRPPPELQVDPPGMQFALGPGESRQESLYIEASRPAAPETFAPIHLNFRLNYSLPGKSALHEGERIVAVELLEVVRRNRGNIAVDGDLREWGELPQAPHGSSSTFRFGLRYDDSYLYLAVLVDALDTPTGDSSRRLAFWLDTYPDGENIEDPLFLVSPGARDPESHFLPSARSPAGLDVASNRVDHGYGTEIRVPWAFFTAEHSGRFHVAVDPVDRRVRVNIALLDGGAEDADALIASWRPRWGSPGDYRWSGVFRFR
jgi:hypothetical protein